MGQATFTTLAKRDLTQIWAYIADDNMDAADATVERLQTLSEKLSSTPTMGRLRPELGDRIRSFGAGNYFIYYWVVEEGIEVLRVAHGARNTAKLFEEF